MEEDNSSDVAAKFGFFAVWGIDNEAFFWKSIFNSCFEYLPLPISPQKKRRTLPAGYCSFTILMPLSCEVCTQNPFWSFPSTLWLRFTTDNEDGNRTAKIVMPPTTASSCVRETLSPLIFFTPSFLFHKSGSMVM